MTIHAKLYVIVEFDYEVLACSELPLPTRRHFHIAFVR